MITIGGRAHSMDEVREVVRFGYPFAELSLDDPAAVAAQLPELLDMQRATGMSLMAHYPNEDNPFDAAVLRERFLPRIRALIDLTQRLGIPKATMHFWMDRRWAPEGLIGKKIEILGEIVAHAAAAGIDICIENLSERFESFRAAFEAISGLKMTLDIGHAQLLARVNTSHGFIEHCMDRIAHVHVHDNRGGTSVKDDLHLPLGQGIVDYPAILASLIEAGYDSTITMEVKPAQMPQTREALLRCIGAAARLP